MGFCSSIQENVVFPNQNEQASINENYVQKCMLVLGQTDFTFNVETKVVTKITQARTCKYEHASNVSVHNLVFELGGCLPPQKKRVEGVGYVQYIDFNAIELGWRQGDPMPFEGFHMGVTSINDNIYTLGGVRRKKSATIKPSYLIEDIHAYNISTGRWRCCGKMAVPRYYHTSASCDGKIFSFGGNSRFGPDITEVECFDPETGLSQVVSQMPFQVDDTCVVNVNDAFYVIGSDVTRSTRRKFLLFDPRATQWFNVQSEMNNVTSSLSACAVGGKICTIAGVYNSSPHVEVFDPQSGKWGFDQPSGTISWMDWKRQRVVPI